MYKINEIEPKADSKKSTISEIKVCGSCRQTLPEMLDRGICPNCGRRS